MTKDKELLDLALEALRFAAAELYTASSYCNTYEVLGNTNDAITAIQQALAAPTVQEPKFWYDEEEGLLHDHFDDAPFGCIPLYTTPPAAKRPFVGLTDEEIEQGCKESWVTEQAFQSAVWWAEAKLMEKNT